MVTFYKLFVTMKRKGTTQKRMVDEGIVSAGTFTNLRHNQNVGTETLAKLCRYLDCKIEDICEYEKED